MSNNMYDHVIKKILVNLDNFEPRQLTAELDDLRYQELHGHVTMWWMDKATQLSDPLRIFFSSHNHGCTCFTMLAIDVINSYFNGKLTRVFEVPHSNGRVKKNTVELMHYMELYKFTS